MMFVVTTVDGRNSGPVEVGSISHYLQGFYTSQVVVWDFWTINSITLKGGQAREIGTVCDVLIPGKYHKLGILHTYVNFFVSTLISSTQIWINQFFINNWNMTNVAIKVIIQVLSVSFSSWTFENLTLYREFSRQKPADTTPGKADARIPVDMMLLMVQKSQTVNWDV